MTLIFRQTTYLISAPSLRESPPDLGAEVAFAGRSNAGKSSAINAICEQKALARTSKTPGRTQMLNFFRITEDKRLVDLPGYGYAKVPDAIKKRWENSMEEFLQLRQSLCGVFLVMDIRHPLSDFDWMMIEWCRYTGRRVHLALTKADKLGRGAAQSTLLKVKSQLTKELPDLAFSLQLFSATEKIGLENARALLDAWLLEEPS